MSTDSLWYEVERIKGWIRRRRIISAIKYTIYAILIIGIILHFYHIYEASQSIQVTMHRTPIIERTGFMAYKITAYPNILNPSDVSFEAKNIYVKIFVNGYYVGETFKPYLKINPGQNPETITFELNLRDLPQIAKESLASNGIIRIAFSGIITIPLKAFGIIPWQEVTVPLDILPEQEFQVSQEDISPLKLELSLVGQLHNISSEVELLKDNLQLLEERIETLEIEEIKSEIRSLREKITHISGILDIIGERTGILEERKETIDVTFEVRDLLDYALTISAGHISISPPYYESISVKENQVTISGMKKDTIYAISIEYTSYNVKTGITITAYPEELDGSVIRLPLADLEIQILDRYYLPLWGAIVRIGDVEARTDIDGKVKFYFVPVEDKTGAPITYHVEIEYAGQLFETDITVSRDSDTWAWIFRLDYP